MKTGLERIADKAREDKKLKFTSIAHHVTKELIWESLCAIPNQTSAGIDGRTVNEAKEDFGNWVEDIIPQIHRCSYKVPVIKRVYIPKPGKSEKRPIGIPTVADRALQRSVSTVLSQIYEQDFLKCSFGGRQNLSAHHALSTFKEIVAGKKVRWVLESDLKNFFGSLDHGWLLRFVDLRVGDPRIISLIRRWLKANIIDEGEVIANKEGTPQGGSISVLLSNIYLHYVLDLWFCRVVKPRMKGEAYLIRYLDDFVVCFQYLSDAKRFEESLYKRLNKFSLSIETSKTKLVEFGRYAKGNPQQKGKKLGTVYFLGFTHYCTRNRKGNFQVGRKTEKSRMRRCIAKLSNVMRTSRHKPLKEQAIEINQILRGHYAYFGMGGNFHSLQRIYRFCEYYWKKMLSSRSQRGNVSWEKFQKIKETFPLQRPRLYVPYSRMKSLAVL